eukprot:PhF_6_TR34158/c0_g1_i1/m.49913
MSLDGVVEGVHVLLEDEFRASHSQPGSPQYPNMPDFLSSQIRNQLTENNLDILVGRRPDGNGGAEVTEESLTTLANSLSQGPKSQELSEQIHKWLSEIDCTPLTIDDISGDGAGDPQAGFLPSLFPLQTSPLESPVASKNTSFLNNNVGETGDTGKFNSSDPNHSSQPSPPKSALRKNRRGSRKQSTTASSVPKPLNLSVVADTNADGGGVEDLPSTRAYLKYEQEYKSRGSVSRPKTNSAGLYRSMPENVYEALAYGLVVAYAAAIRAALTAPADPPALASSSRPVSTDITPQLPAAREKKTARIVQDHVEKPQQQKRVAPQQQQQQIRMRASSNVRDLALMASMAANRAKAESQQQQFSGDRRRSSIAQAQREQMLVIRRRNSKVASGKLFRWKDVLLSRQHRWHEGESYENYVLTNECRRRGIEIPKGFCDPFLEEVMSFPISLGEGVCVDRMVFTDIKRMPLDLIKETFPHLNLPQHLNIMNALRFYRQHQPNKEPPTNYVLRRMIGEWRTALILQFQQEEEIETKKQKRVVEDMCREITFELVARVCAVTQGGLKSLDGGGRSGGITFAMSLDERVAGEAAILKLRQLESQLTQARTVVSDLDLEKKGLIARLNVLRRMQRKMEEKKREQQAVVVHEPGVLEAIKEIGSLETQIAILTENIERKSKDTKDVESIVTNVREDVDNFREKMEAVRLHEKSKFEEDKKQALITLQSVFTLLHFRIGGTSIANRNPENDLMYVRSFLRKNYDQMLKSNVDMTAMYEMTQVLVEQHRNKYPDLNKLLLPSNIVIYPNADLSVLDVPTDAEDECNNSTNGFGGGSGDGETNWLGLNSGGGVGFTSSTLTSNPSMRKDWKRRNTRRLLYGTDDVSAMATSVMWVTPEVPRRGELKQRLGLWKPPIVTPDEEENSNRYVPTVKPKTPFMNPRPRDADQLEPWWHFPPPASFLATTTPRPPRWRIPGPRQRQLQEGLIGVVLGSTTEEQTPVHSHSHQINSYGNSQYNQSASLAPESTM